MSTTCFVTGAGGFVGRALVNSLLAQGNHVRALDVRFPSDRPDDATRLRGDIRDRSLLEQGCRDAEFVFHCAALLPQRHAAAAVMRLTNVEGAGHLFNAALRARVSRAVMLSSTEVYGVPATVPCPEEAPQRPLGEYGRNKVEAEQLARDANDRGLQVVILRPTTVVGPRMTDRVLLTTLTALHEGWPIVVPGGRGRFQMVALSDLVDACLAASRATGVAGEAFNVGADAVPSQQQVFRELRTRVSSWSPVVPVPRSLLRGLFRLLLALGRSPLEPEHISIALADYMFDIRKAWDRLGWRPAKGNVEALAEAYHWLTGTGPGASTNRDVSR